MKFKLTTLSAFVMFTISGCVTAPADKAVENIENETDITSQKLRQAEDITAGRINTQVIDGYYLGSKSFKRTNEDKLPSIFEEKNFVFNDPNQISLQELITKFGREFGVKTLLTSDAIAFVRELESGSEEEKVQKQDMNNINSFDIIDSAGKGLVGSKVKFSIDFNDTGASFLDYISAKTNLFWKWENNQLTFFRTDTRTLKVDYLGGTNTFNASVSSSFDATATSDSDSVGANSGGNAQNTSANFSPKNVWASLAEELESLKSEEGKFAIAEEAGIVTVIDTPRNLDLIESHIKDLNKSIGQQIAIRTEIYDVVLDENAELGTNWEAAYGKGSNYAANLSTAFGDVASSAFGISLTDEASRFNGTQAFIKSLNEVSEVSYRTSATVHTTNGMAAPIQMLDTTGYLSEVVREVSETGGKSSTSAKQATATSGFSLSFLPKVTSNGDVNVLFAGDLTQLRGFNESNIDGTTLQKPNGQNKNFLQRVIVKSGESIMVAGFERTESTHAVDSLAGESTYLLGGRKSGGTKKVITVIVLTPYVK